MNIVLRDLVLLHKKDTLAIFLEHVAEIEVLNVELKFCNNYTSESVII